MADLSNPLMPMPPMNKIYLMTPIFSDTTERICQQMDCVPKDQAIEIDMNCPGGSVFAGWTLIGKMAERAGKTNINVYGHAASMAAYMLLFADYVEGLEVTRYLIHRADGYVETEDDQKNLDDINADLRKQMELRLNMAKFTEITGLTIDDIFNGQKQKDCWLNSKQAKKVGLIHAIKRFTVPEQKAFNEKFVAFIPERGSDGPQGSGEKATDIPNINSQIPLKMNRDELKAQHPDVYAAIHAEGMAQGQTQERERVQACMAYIDIDKDNVIAMIKDGKQINQAVMAEMQVKMFASAKITALGKDGKQIPPVKTGEASDKTEDEEEVKALEDQVMAGVKKINLF